MKRVRRIVTAAAAASLAAAGLTGCSVADPQAAVYFGDSVHLTNDRVQQLLDDAQDKAERANAQAAALATQQTGKTVAAQPVQLRITRNDVVRFVLQSDVLTAIAQKNGIPVPPDAQLDVQGAGTSLGTTGDADIAMIAVRADALGQQVAQAIKPGAAPTEDDLQHVYAGFVKAGAPKGQYDQFKSSLTPENLQAISQADAVRDQIQDTARALKIKVNPKYGPMRLGLLSASASAGGGALIDATLEGVDLTGPVTDVSQ